MKGVTGRGNRSRPGRSRAGALSLLWLGGLSLVVGSSGQVQSAGQVLVITKGGRYSGSWESLNPAVPAVSIRTSEPVTLENCTLRGRGALIDASWVKARLTVRNCRGLGLNPRDKERAPGRFLQAEGVVSVLLEHNLLDRTSGIYINGWEGDGQNPTTIVIRRNVVRNIEGRYSDGAGGWQERFYRVQFVQLNRVRSIPRAEIAWNEVINQPGQSRVEEIINIYESSGTPSSPIAVHNNYLQGAYPAVPHRDTKYSGGGIMIGDGRPDSLDITGGYVNVFRNQVVSTSNQGIAIAGGHNQHVYENRLLSSGRLPDQRLIPSNNVGAYMWDYQDGAKRRPSTFFKNSIRNNLIGWMRYVGPGASERHALWVPSCTAATASVCVGNRPWPTAVTLETEQQEYQLWQQKLKAQGIVPGPKG